jgi:hypothetical protein
MPQARLSRALKLFGTDSAEGKRRELRVGELSAVLDGGALRTIRYRGHEVLRGIAYLVRDRNWGTYAPAIEGLKVRQSKAGFAVGYAATCRDAEQAIRYEATIEGRADGTLVFAATGTPLTDFLTNRTGFVVLHPLAGVVGQPVEVLHTDARKERARFPKFISPGQPLLEIRSLKHTVTPGLTATVLMEGNKFEMEDHRNWMDASYKTYVCSLLDPWPYTLDKGKAFRQSITVSVAGKPPAKSARRAGGTVAVALSGVKGRLPALAVGVPMAEARPALAAAELVAAARPAALVCQIDGRREGQAEAAAMFRELSEKAGAPVTLEIVLPAREPAEKEVGDIAAAARACRLSPSAVVVTQRHDLKSFQPNTPRPWGPTFEEMAEAARKAFPGAAVGGGMLSYFTELNRKRPPKGVFDFITHTVCPIVHAADDISVMETLESLPSIFASTRAIIGRSPYHLGPSSIAARDNPYGAAVAPNPGNGRVCLSDMDPRQRGLYGAAWYLGLIARAADAAIDSLALGAATGPQGLIYRNTDYPQPWFDGSGAPVYPAYHVLAGFSGGRARRIEVENSAPTQVAAVAFRAKTGPMLWLANLTGAAQRVKVAGFGGGALVHVMDDGSCATLARDPAFLSKGGAKLKRVASLELGPYAVARVKAA